MSVGNMRHDPEHYQRFYMMCRGSGGTHDQCIKIPDDYYISNSNPVEKVYERELVGGIQCMMKYQDDSKCQHYIQGIHRMLLRHAT
eukprot:GHVR01170482.1.p1 GENE.GHVR01170482.1~~GHVR01170482.1.p1  ORF type:complete len:101 (+),score=21.12 GHVR01170482.1:46-303(+)